MNIYKKTVIICSILALVFCVGFCYGYRDVIRKNILTAYFQLVKWHVYSTNADISASKIKKDISENEEIIKKDMPVLFVDKKHYVENKQDKIVEDITKHSSSTIEGFTGKKIKDIYNKLKTEKYMLEIKNNEMICTRKYTEGKYVAKIKNGKYEIFKAKENGELELVESGGNINYKEKDESLFNQNTREYSSLEEARESLADFTS